MKVINVGAAKTKSVAMVREGSVNGKGCCLQ